VTAIPPDDFLSISSRDKLIQHRSEGDDQSSEPLLCFAGSSGSAGDRPAIDFWVGRSAASGFPLRVWRRIGTKLLSGESQYPTDYCDPAGLPQLRRAIADHLGRTRGMDVTTEQIVVTAGGQDALNLVLNLLRTHTAQLCIEGIFELLQLKAADILMPDLQRMGGPTEFLKVAALCEAFDIPVSSHVFPQMSLALMACVPNASYHEYINWFDALYQEPLMRDERGASIVPTRPVGASASTRPY